MALLNQVRRAIYSPQGQQLASRLRRVLKPVITMLGMRHLPGLLPLDTQRPTVVVVSHEASATGAPILALNLCQRLSSHANVVVLLLRGGPLIEDFQQVAVEILQPRLNLVFASLLKRELQRVSAPFIQPLRSIGVPPITLIHEFSAYIRPLELLNDVGVWSSTMVFASSSPARASSQSQPGRRQRRSLPRRPRCQHSAHAGGRRSAAPQRCGSVHRRGRSLLPCGARRSMRIGL